MWILKNTTNGKQYFLTCNKDIVVGRKDADIVISGDSSVSRRHGTLRIEHLRAVLKNPGAIPAITCIDSSKFGTSVTHAGGQKIKIDGTESLKSGDIIQFGAQRSIFELSYSPLVITTSMLDNDLKEKLAESLLRIGGHMVSNWHDSVTHLLVENIKLSLKVTRALVSACHIVNPEFVFKIDAVLGSVGSIPDPLEYIPVLAEPNLSRELCCFKVNRKRETVFKDRVLLFLTKKQQKHMGPIISAGGGNCLLADDPSIDDDILSNSQTAVVNCRNVDLKDSVLCSSRYEYLQEILLVNERRFIGEHEIGLAVLYCDASVYCNPAFDLNSQNVFTQRQSLESHSDESCDPAPSKTVVFGKSTANACKSEIKPVETNLVSDPKSQILYNQSSKSKLSRKRSRSPELENMPCQADGEPASNLTSKKMARIAVTSLTETLENDCHVTPATGSAPDSYLDDDHLWSQNLESASSIRQEKKPFCKEPEHNLKDGEKLTKPVRSNASGALIENMAPKCEPTSIAQQPFVKLAEVENQLLDLGSKPNQEECHPTCGQIFSGCFDPSLPVGLAQVSVWNLITKRVQVAVPWTHAARVKNFKRFRKVWPTYMANQMRDAESDSSHPPIPHIIGGNDFFTFGDRQEKSRDIEEWLDQESQSSNPFLLNMPGLRNKT